MKKKILSMTLALMMLIALVPGISVGAASVFPDVPEGHWAHAIISELTDEGVINGMDDGTFKPEGLVTREQFMKLLVCALNYDVDSVGGERLPDVDGTSWADKYILAGLEHGIFSLNDDALFHPGDELKRGVAVTWIINGIGVDTEAENIFPDIADPKLAHSAAIANKLGLVSGYEDGCFRPEGTLSRAEAAALIKRIMDYMSRRFALRDDAKNEIVFRDNVVLGTSSPTTNVPVDADERESTVTFKYADSTLTELEPGEILFIAPCGNFPGGLLGKVEEVYTGKNETTIEFSQPELCEVVESMDISIYASPTMDSFADDGDLRAVKVGGYAALDEKSGFNLDFIHDSEVTLEFEGKTVVINADVDEGTTVTYKTPGFEEKDGLYASLDMGVLVKVDVKLETSLVNVKVFNASADIITDIHALVGYSVSGSKEVTYDLSTETIPVAGILNVVINSKLVAGANGKFTVEATADLVNTLGMSFDLESGFETHNLTDSHANLFADAEGSLEVGPRENVKLTLCGIRIPIINKTLFDGVSLLSADADMGFGVKGALASNLSAHLTNDGLTFNDSDEDELHLCYVCIDGNVYDFFRGEIGLGDDMADLLKKVTDKKLSHEFSLPETEFLFWHFSNGDGYSNEFELQKCPHYGYKTTVNVVDNEGKAISGAAVTFGGKTYTTGADGRIKTHLTKGSYAVAAEADGYEAGSANISIVASPAEITITLDPLNAEYKHIDGVLGGTVGSALFYYKSGGIYRRTNGKSEKIVDAASQNILTNGSGIFYVGKNQTLNYINCDGSGAAVIKQLDVPNVINTYDSDMLSYFSKDELSYDPLAIYGDKLFYGCSWIDGCISVSALDLNSGNVIWESGYSAYAPHFTDEIVQQCGKYLIGNRYAMVEDESFNIHILDMETLTIKSTPFEAPSAGFMLAGNGFYYCAMSYDKNYKASAQVRYYNLETGQDYQIFDIGATEYYDRCLVYETCAIYSVKGKAYARDFASGDTVSIGTFNKNNRMSRLNEDSGKCYFRFADTLYEYSGGKLTKLKDIRSNSCYVLNGEDITW
ncbi:MAG: S-layer homology domain-containing protein [Oscillospiraceae bacterium]|nr:S-layer homology domain-containing protein [Oscillospiraceae bacterium]